MDIQSTEAVTPKLFTFLLESSWRDNRDSNGGEDGTVKVPEILSLSTQRVEQGVLSQVYKVHLEYNLDLPSLESCPPSDWLLKLCRTDLNLSWMCRNEAHFYRSIVPHLVQESDSTLPFSIPTFLSGDDHHIILQEVLDVETTPLTDGCPPDKIPLLLKCLVALHAKCWNGSGEIGQCAKETLVFPAGMGQRLNPLQKEGLFVKSWQDTMDHMDFHPEHDGEIVQFITKFCQKLETIKIRDVHDLLHRHRVTLIHGDFHISNFLFPKHEYTDISDYRPYLVDWATAGYGNPMIDLVFFLVVSTNDQVVSDIQGQLEEYHQLLLLMEPRLKDAVSVDTLNEWFKFALICQWTILVAYDEVCRQIALNEPDKGRREMQLQHFKNVNRRAILALKSVGDWDDVWDMLKLASEDERNEASEYCERTPLTI
jgi:Ecdysteroid kinase-like family